MDNQILDMETYISVFKMRRTHCNIKYKTERVARTCSAVNPRPS